MAKGLHFWAMVGLASLACFRAGAMTEDECDAFYRLDEAEKARRFAVMGEADKWSYIASAVRRLNDLSLEPPKLILNTLPRYGYDKNDYAMNNGVAVTAKGRIWVSWIGGEDGPKAHMLETWSEDGGRSWRVPTPAKTLHHIMSRFSLIRLSSGSLLFIKHGASPLAHPPLTAQERKEENPWVVHYTLRRELTAFVSRNERELEKKKAKIETTY